MASREILIVDIVQIVSHVGKWTEALCFMDGRFVVIFDMCNQYHCSLIAKQNKTDGFTVMLFNVI